MKDQFEGKKAKWIKEVQTTGEDIQGLPQVVIGYYGDADAEGEIRIYLDADLAEYIDVAQDAILFDLPVKDPQLQPNAYFIVIKPAQPAEKPTVRFLSGHKVKSYAPQAPEMALEPVAELAPSVINWRCPTRSLSISCVLGVCPPKTVLEPTCFAGNTCGGFTCALNICTWGAICDLESRIQILCGRGLEEYQPPFEAGTPQYEMRIGRSQLRRRY